MSQSLYYLLWLLPPENFEPDLLLPFLSPPTPLLQGKSQFYFYLFYYYLYILNISINKKRRIYLITNLRWEGIQFWLTSDQKRNSLFWSLWHNLELLDSASAPFAFSRGDANFLRFEPSISSFNKNRLFDFEFDRYF